VGSDRFTETPQGCQDLCRDLSHTDCKFFTHYDTECYLLSTCDVVEPCEGCMSGPVDPLLSDCQATTMAPETTTMVETTTVVDSTTVAETTTMPETTTMAESTTMEETTTMVVTTTVPETTIAKCDVNAGSLCDAHENLIEQIEGISSASDCQAVCQNHAECEYWSHYSEEGPEHWGYCQLHYNCDRTTDHECYPEGSHECRPTTHELFGEIIDPRPGDWKCHCVSGAKTPDLDECDDGTTDDPSTCADDFWPGWLCDEASSEVIEHIEHISESSDCQAICQNHPECHYFSHYTEEGGEHWGHCFLHRNCNNFNDHECRQFARPGCPPANPLLESFYSQFENDDSFSGEPRPGPGPKCNCICGPQYPDMDDCSNPELY